MHLISTQMQEISHYLISFGNKLHITIFDAIMNHFYKMTCTIFTNPVTAWSAIINFAAIA